MIVHACAAQPVHVEVTNNALSTNGPAVHITRELRQLSIGGWPAQEPYLSCVCTIPGVAPAQSAADQGRQRGAADAARRHFASVLVGIGCLAAAKTCHS